MRLICNIKRTPANATSLKIAHFSNIGVSEVFLEATPTTFLTTALLVSAYDNQGPTSRNTGLHEALFGGEWWTELLFWVGYLASVLSSAFGVSR